MIDGILLREDLFLGGFGLKAARVCFVVRQIIFELLHLVVAAISNI